MRACPAALALFALALAALAFAEEWSRARIEALPDSAFAAIEVTPDGKPLRHLPHHDETGAVDPAHLRSALSRLGQVKWLDPANAAAARRHLEEHRRAMMERQRRADDVPHATSGSARAALPRVRLDGAHRAGRHPIPPPLP